MRHDELSEAKKEADILKNFKEGSLTFDPTYKYALNSNEYESITKIRTPAWCDRILYEDDNNNLT
jgi:phosphatidylinositol-bisphosphatase